MINNYLKKLSLKAKVFFVIEFYIDNWFLDPGGWGDINQSDDVAVRKISTHLGGLINENKI